MRKKKRHIQTTNGKEMTISSTKYNKIKECRRYAHRNGWEVVIHDDLTFSLKERNGENYLIGKPTHGSALGGFRKRLFNLKQKLREKKEREKGNRLIKINKNEIRTNQNNLRME